MADTPVPLLERLTQRRTPESAPEVRLNRCLGVFDLVNSGFSVVVGAGIFVITPVLTANTTGPAVTISYLIAGLAALLSALTYAELASRFSGIGSAYLYVYYVLGELAAGVIGISMVMEMMIGLASLVKSLSIYSDQLLFNGTIIAWETNNLAMHVPFMTKYVDLFGLGILLICGCLNLWGVKQTMVVSAICNVAVVASLILVIIMGFVKGSSTNWFDIVPESSGLGHGGYFPYGVSGVFTGASLAYFSYGGFDAIACLGCEARNPQRDIPLSIILTFGLVMTLYVLVCGAITHVAPYYTLSHEAGMALAFSAFPWVVVAVSLGGVLATATGSFGGVLATSRIVLSMAQDGIMFKQLTYLSKSQVPVVAICVSMVPPALGILLLDIEELVMMNSGGALICFCLTNICVIVGRYQPHHTVTKGHYTTSEMYTILLSLLFWVCSLVASLCLKKLGLTVLGITLGTVFLLAGAVLLVIIHHNFSEVKVSTTFMCPLVPWLPGVGVFINSALMVSLPLMTWLRVGVCFLFGLACYASYGVSHSNLTLAKTEKRVYFHQDGTGSEARLSNSKSPDGYNDQDKLVGNEL